MFVLLWILLYLQNLKDCLCVCRVCVFSLPIVLQAVNSCFDWNTWYFWTQQSRFLNLTQSSFCWETDTQEKCSVASLCPVFLKPENSEKLSFGSKCHLDKNLLFFPPQKCINLCCSKQLITQRPEIKHCFAGYGTLLCHMLCFWTYF